MAFGLGSRVGSAAVKLVVDDSDFHRDLARDQAQFRRTASGMESDFNRLGRGALAGSGAFSHLGRSIAFASSTFLGAAGFTALVRNSINAASDLHEQINKVDVVFRGSQKQVLDWSESTAKSIGVARGQALGFAATFGNLLVPMGITRDKAAEMSVQFVKLAADLASFNNASPEDTLRALQSGLAGQVRPLRQFGIFLDQNRIKAEALRLGLLKGNVDLEKVGIANERVAIAQAKYNQALKEYGPQSTQAASAHVALQVANNNLAKATSGVTGQLTQQQKVLATTSIIMRDSKDAQGDFARTSGGLANQQRILRAEITDMEEKLGTALLPTVLKITKAITNWLGQSKNQKAVQRDLNAVIRIAGDLFGALHDVVKDLAPVVHDLTDAVGGTKNAFKLLIGLALVGKLNAIAKSVGLIGTNATAASGSAARGTGVAGLLKNLRLLGAIGVITLTVEIYEKLIPDFKGKHYSGIDLARDIGKKLGIGGSPDSPQYKNAITKGFTTVFNGRVYRWNGTRWVDITPAGPTSASAGAAGAGAIAGGAATGAPAGASSVVGIALTAARSPGASSRSFHLPGEARPYDCSAFVQAVFAHAGIHIGRDTYAQAAGGRSIAKADLQPGDIILFNITSDTQRAPNHVGIYVGGGMMVHDHGDRSGGVSYQAVPWGAFWGARCYIGGHVHKGAFTGKGGGGGGGGTGPGLATGGDPSSGTKATTTAKKSPPKPPKPRQGYTQIGGTTGLGITPPSAPVAKPGQTEVNIPGIGKILVGTESAPTLDQIRSTIVDVYNKIKAAQSRRAAKAKALAKLLKVKKPNAKQRASITKLRRDIQALDKTIADLKDDLGQYIGAANDLAAEMASDEEAKAGESEGDAGTGPEADTSIAQGSVTDIPTGLSYQVAQGQFTGDYGLTVGGLRAEEALLTARLATTSDLGQRIDLMSAISGVRDQIAGAATSISPSLQLAQAQARLTASPLDDRAITQQLKDITEARLKEATTIQEQIALTNQLADLKSQLNDQQGQENAQLIAYLSARRELSRTFASNVLGRALAGSSITVQNFNQPTPEDPHLWSVQTAFELQALVS